MSSLVVKEEEETDDGLNSSSLGDDDTCPNTSSSSDDSLDTTVSSVNDEDFCVMSNFVNTLLNILSNNDNKPFTTNVLEETFCSFINHGIDYLGKAEILNIDKKNIVNICRDIKVQHPQLWTKDIAKLFGTLLKTIVKAKAQALKAPEEPVEGSYVEAFWANKSWCCGRIDKVHYYNHDGSVYTISYARQRHLLVAEGATASTNNDNNSDTSNDSIDKIIKYDISYLDSSTEKNISRDRIRLLDNRARYLAEAVKNENYSLFFQYIKEFQHDSDTERIFCGLMALVVYSPEWRQSIGDSHKLSLLQMGAGKILVDVIQRNSIVPYGEYDIANATNEIKNSVAAIDKALRAMYNFTFHQIDDVQETLVHKLLNDGANEIIYSSLQAFPHVHDIQRWGRLTLQRLNYSYDNLPTT
jgi:hypothetical protein